MKTAFGRAPGAGCAFIIFALLAGGSAQAADASPWAKDLHSGARLIAAAMTTVDGHPIYRAGIEITLAPGWHTYWRYPGDAGVPPRFNFTGSENVKSVAVRWPAPHLFSEAGLNTIGFIDHLILPLRVTPRVQGKPVTLRLKFEYAVCEKLCLPVEARIELTMDGKPTPLDGTLDVAEKLVPKKVAVGAQEPLAIRSVHQEPGEKLPRIVVDVAAPKGAKVSLFAEGPTPEWALPVPTPMADAPDGVQRFSFDLDGLPPGAKSKGALITLTAVSGSEAIEVTTRLD
jgi:DsbC/DsbD-like thiol-disulfide interchange protein